MHACCSLPLLLLVTALCSLLLLLLPALCSLAALLMMLTNKYEAHKNDTCINPSFLAIKSNVQVKIVIFILKLLFHQYEYMTSWTDH
jgi:hypothetical protein